MWFVVSELVSLGGVRKKKERPEPLERGSGLSLGLSSLYLGAGLRILIHNPTCLSHCP